MDIPSYQDLIDIYSMKIAEYISVNKPNPGRVLIPLDAEILRGIGATSIYLISQYGKVGGLEILLACFGIVIPSNDGSSINIIAPNMTYQAYVKKPSDSITNYDINRTFSEAIKMALIKAIQDSEESKGNLQ